MRGLLTLVIAAVFLAATPAADFQWTEVTSTQGGFRALFPGTATYQVQDVPTDLGVLKMHCWLLDVGASGYAVLYGDYTTTHVQTVGAEVVVTNAVRGLRDSWQQGGAFEREIPLVMGGYPGREYTMEAQGYINKGRTLLIGTRLFQVLARAPVAQRATAMADIDRFLQSFALIATPR